MRSTSLAKNGDSKTSFDDLAAEITFESSQGFR